MVDSIKKNKKLTGKSGASHTDCSALQQKVSEANFLSKENQLKVRDSSFASLSEVDTLPPSLPHHLLQVLILLEACSIIKETG